MYDRLQQRTMEVHKITMHEINEKLKGISLRDLFAMNALNGLIGLSTMNYEQMANDAYALADEMLKARRK